MKRRIILPLVVLVLGAGGGAVFGLWWSTTTERRICQRIETECGEAAIPMSDCLQGRQHDLLRYGVAAMRRVDACLTAAPHDCLSVSACLGAAEE